MMSECYISMTEFYTSLIPAYYIGVCIPNTLFYIYFVKMYLHQVIRIIYKCICM